MSFLKSIKLARKFKQKLLKKLLVQMMLDRRLADRASASCKSSFAARSRSCARSLC